MRRAVIVLVSLYFGYCALMDISAAKITLETDSTNIGAITLLCTRALITTLAAVIVWLVDIGCTIDGISGVKIEEQSDVLGQSS